MDIDTVTLYNLIRDELEGLTIEEWWDYGDFREIKDKDYVANSIVSSVVEYLEKIKV